MNRDLFGDNDKFQEFVGIKFQLYNSLFLSLPFYGVDKTGILLSLFSQNCGDGFDNGLAPTEIIDQFFKDRSEDEKVDLLFRFVQYAERQVVLFDALEDAAFSQINDLTGTGTVKDILSSVKLPETKDELIKKLKDFGVRLVLTAHPTQFYPGTVLGIINDLVDAIAANNAVDVNSLLQQLGRTPFFKKQKPTPFDEALSQIWYLEFVFYQAIGNIIAQLRQALGSSIDLSRLIRLGFWSGGDRDGNPFVTADTTVETAAALRKAILRCYYRDVKFLKRRLTFSGVESLIAELENEIYFDAFVAPEPRLTTEALLKRLTTIRTLIVEKHNGLFVHPLEALIDQVSIFGLYFASLDIRQDSSQHRAIIDEIAASSDALPTNYQNLSDDEKITALLAARVCSAELSGLAADTLKTIKAVKTIKATNGSAACERYIISHCQSALNVIEVYGLFLAAGWNSDEIDMDIVPLFETVADLENAADVMKQLYEMPQYREHLKKRGNRQTIMLGFSDGTKDGGYLMANWSIYKAKDRLSTIAKQYGIAVIFFDGRGGPPARGGGKTHKFYSSMGQNIADHAIELTIQGQTISSNFGTVTSAQYNIEQLINSGIYNDVFAPLEMTFSGEEESLMKRLANDSFAEYQKLKDHPHFMDYLINVSPLTFYAQTNIGSRPAKRGSGKLNFDDLRAIPFVGAWSQIKQNVPGFYGVGSALKRSEADIDQIAAMYRENKFFKALIDNCEMAMQKSFLPLTAFMRDEPVYGDIWQKIADEFELCRKYLGKVTGSDDLMTDLPFENESVKTRERIVLPLITIQQYALTKLRLTDGLSDDERGIYEKLVIRCSFGIINAGRNSA